MNLGQIDILSEMVHQGLALNAVHVQEDGGVYVLTSATNADRFADALAAARHGDNRLAYQPLASEGGDFYRCELQYLDGGLVQLSVFCGNNVLGLVEEAFERSRDRLVPMPPEKSPVVLFSAGGCLLSLTPGEGWAGRMWERFHGAGRGETSLVDMTP